ncbi:MAG TPA: non-homologous end-joining DNA ligase [Nocardioidaceae bacterium]|nr:non-homologous end-joining DNA ligase [Nocardioidaceae bacterium]
MNAKAETASEIGGVEISKPDKVLFPDDGITKADLAGYYADVADAMLPHLADRPVNMQRFPDGIAAGSFYEKKVPSHFPDWVHTVTVDTADGAQQQVVIADRRALVYLADQACVTPHAWLSRSGALDAPDQMVFDLDPPDDGTGSFDDVRRATTLVGACLDDLGLTTYLKTTGSRGYHVVVPLRPDADFDTVRGLARDIAAHLAEREPDLLTVEQRKNKRGDRIFVDVLRNGYGQTAVAPYAVRARPGAPVATPLEWDELSEVEPADFTVESVLRRLGQHEDPWKGIRRHAQGLRKAQEKLAKTAG